ncbi:MAG TPA: hypothetical protein VK571_02375 [Gemmatimonadaceae bacterium]|nr:hypothetical protein [Gemmatimonadaceae bacterium]
MPSARILSAPQSALLKAEAARRECLARIDERFGWLKRLVALHGGSIDALKPHERQLWHARESVVGTYNHIGLIPDLGRRERAYRRLSAECTRLR